MLVGPLSSSVCRTTSIVMNTFNVGIISYAASDPGLSNKDLYPLFFRSAAYKSVSVFIALSKEISVAISGTIAIFDFLDFVRKNFRKMEFYAGNGLLGGGARPNGGAAEPRRRVGSLPGPACSGPP